jgi:hypothetical protein
LLAEFFEGKKGVGIYVQAKELKKKGKFVKG